MKKQNGVIFIFLLCCTFFSCAIVRAEDFPSIYSDKAILYDINDNNFLYTKNSEVKTSVASVTKILSVITAIENVDDLGAQVKITPQMLKSVDKSFSKAGLKVGDSVTYKDLIYASLLPSGADATMALAYSISGDVNDYVTLMNKTAKKIGMIDSNFVNPTELDNKNHYSTAQDILTLLLYSIKNPIFLESFSSTNYELSNGLRINATYFDYLKNKGMDSSKFLGGKTGTTGDAGKCFVGAFKSGDHMFIAVLLNSEYSKMYNYSIDDFVELYKFIDKNFAYQTLMSEGSIVQKVNVKYATEAEYKVMAQRDIIKYLPEYYDKSKFQAVYKSVEDPTVFTKYGTEIGVVDYYYDNDVIYSEEVLFNQKSDMNYSDILRDYKFEFAFMITALYVIVLLIIMIRRLFYISFKTV